MRPLPLLALLLACWTAAAPADWLAQTLSEGLTAEQRRALGAEPRDEAVASALTAPQREAARARLRAAENGADEHLKPQIARGYALLGGSAAPGDGSKSHADAGAVHAAGLENSVGGSRSVAQARRWLDQAPVQPGISRSAPRGSLRLRRAAPLLAPEDARGVPAPAEMDLAYHTSEASKPWLVVAIWQGLKDRWDFSHHAMTPAEVATLAAVKGRIDSTPTGRQLVADLGGWRKIESDVTLKFSPISGHGTLGQAFPMGLRRSDGGYAPYGIALNSSLAGESEELLATVLAHELSHVRDHEQFGSAPELSIASEFQAHRTEVYVFEELLREMPEQRRRALAGDKYWEYTRFVVSLWEDHILQRYRTRADYEAQFATKNAANLAGLAYDDLVRSLIPPGSPQLDYHVKDLYAAATREPDGGGDAGTEQARARLLAGMNVSDIRYRAVNGFRVEAGAR